MSGQLYRLTTEGFHLPTAVDEQGRPHTSQVGRIPIVFWPDGAVCWEANLYLQHRLREGDSTRNRGGTLREYANHLSHLLRYCQAARVHFIDLTDAHFKRLLVNLSGEVDRTRPEQKKRGGNQVISIGRTCLRFLQFVDYLYPGVGLVGRNGRIRAEQKTARVQMGRAGIREVSYLHHRDLPTPVARERRLPISTEAIEKLYAANRALSPSSFIEERRSVMLHLFESLGARRIEISRITVSDVKRAMEAGPHTGFLRVSTAKQRGRHVQRYIPLPSGDLQRLGDYIELYRRRVIRRTIGLENDHGFLLISETTGQPLTLNALTSVELARLRKAAGLADRNVCLHAFRHRFITKRLVYLIEKHRFSAEDQLRKALLDIEIIKRQVMEWTGHSSLVSLEPYIHLAFEEATGFKRTVDALVVRQECESLVTRMRDLWDGMQAAGPARTMEQMEALWRAVWPRLESAVKAQADRMQLTGSEQEALHTTISPTCLEQRRWTEDKDGRILDEGGRPLLPAGFTHAIRKLLGERANEPMAS